MTKEIIIENINNNGYCSGKTIRGKGIEVFRDSSPIVNSWGADLSQNIDEKNRLKKALERHFDALVTAIKIRSKAKGSESYRYSIENWEKSVEKFNIKTIVDNDFSDVLSISIKTTPKFLGYIPISKYDSSIESQKDMILKVLSFDSRYVYGEEFYDTYNEPDSLIEFSSKTADGDLYNGDYGLVHGSSICENTSYAEKMDCRVSNYNDSVVTDFWNFTMEDEDVFEYDDPQEKISVYHRKGKDWYVAFGMEEEEIYLSYKDKYGDIEEEPFTVYIESGTQEDKETALTIIRGMLFNVELNGCIYNNLGIGSYDNYKYIDSNESMFNLNILEKNECSYDLYEIASNISEFIDYKKGSIDDKVKMAYEKWLRSKLDDNDCLFGKYKHLPMLRTIVEQGGKELVITKPYGDVSEPLYAVRYGKEEYHFFLSELFDSSPMEFYDSCSRNLTKRILEVKEKTNLISRASRVFVGLEDSFESGNCKSGTQEFCRQHNIDTKEIGGIRGDVLLNYDYSNYTRRAVATALKR